jgi:hypothetical protein
MNYRSGGEGGILDQASEPTSYVFSNMRENRMEIRDFCHLACFNCLSCFVYLGLISALDRHQRHQVRCLRRTPNWPPTFHQGDHATAETDLTIVAGVICDRPSELR